MKRYFAITTITSALERSLHNGTELRLFVDGAVPRKFHKGIENELDNLRDEITDILDKSREEYSEESSDESSDESNDEEEEDESNDEEEEEEEPSSDDSDDEEEERDDSLLSFVFKTDSFLLKKVEEQIRTMTKERSEPTSIEVKWENLKPAINKELNERYAGFGLTGCFDELTPDSAKFTITHRPASDDTHHPIANAVRGYFDDRKKTRGKKKSYLYL